MLALTMLCFAMLIALTARADHAVISSSPSGKKAIIECVDQIYNFDFAKAENSIRQLAQEYPGHPAINLLSGTSKYWQWFPVCTNKQQEKQLRDQLELASRNASDWISGSGKETPEAMFIYFSAEGLLARMDNSQHATMAAIGHAKNAYPYVKRSFRLQKTYPDFTLIAGLYNYFRVKYVEIKPFYKALVWFMQDGNKTEGLRQIDVAAKTSLFSKAEAGTYLADIWANFEKQPVRALTGLYELLELYPNNLYVQGKLAEILLSAGNPSKALPYIQTLIDSDVSGYIETGMVSRARYNVQIGNLGAAVTDANAVLALKVQDEHLAGFAHQVLAQVEDRRGRVTQAKQHYKKVRELSEFPLQIDEAEAYLKTH